MGGYFAKAGEDVTLIDPWPGHVDAMNANGLSLSGTTEAESFTTPVKAIHLTEVQSLMKAGPIDIAFITVKAYDTAWATMMIKDYLAPDGVVVSLQNCINEETIAGVVGWGRVVGCIAAKIAVELKGPATVRRGGPKGGDKHTVFRVGEAHGRITPRIEHIAKMLSDVDSAMTTPNLWGERWSKLCANAGQRRVGGDRLRLERLRPRSGHPVADDQLAKAAHVGQSLGYSLEKISKSPPEVWIRPQASPGVWMKRRMRPCGTGQHQGRLDDNRPPWPGISTRAADGDRADQRLCRGESRRDRTFGTGEFGAREAVKTVERGLVPPAPERVQGI